MQLVFIRAVPEEISRILPDVKGGAELDQFGGGGIDQLWGGAEEEK